MQDVSTRDTLSPATPPAIDTVSNHGLTRSARPVTLWFCLIAILQSVGLLGAAATLPASALPAAIVAVLLLGSAAFGAVARWDRRQLDQGAGPRDEPWEWALIFPPAYLLMRRENTTGTSPKALWWIQLALAGAVVVIAGILLAGTPALVVDGPATPISGAQIAATVTQSWAETGDEGTVTCADPTSQQAGTQVSCQGRYDGSAVTFTARLGADDDLDSVTVTGWSFTN